MHFIVVHKLAHLFGFFLCVSQHMCAPACGGNVTIDLAGIPQILAKIRSFLKLLERVLFPPQNGEPLAETLRREHLAGWEGQRVGRW